MNHASSSSPPAPGPSSRVEFARRVWIVAGVVVLVAASVAVAVAAAPVFILAFAAVLLAILLRTAADALARWTGMGPGWGLGVVAVALVGILAGAVYFVGATADDQFAKLADELPKAVARARELLEGRPWGRQLLRWEPAAQDAVAGRPGEAASRVAALFSTGFGVVGDLVVLFFLTFYLAASPGTYVDGLTRLVPPRGRGRAREVAAAAGERLKGWMLGQVVGMATVGVLSGIGLRLAGVPQYFALGLIVGLFNAVPYLGPILGAIPGLLVALTLGPSTVGWALLAYVAAGSLEGYVVTPMVQRRTSAMPPALTLVAIALGGALLGVVGMIVAAPAAVLVQVLVEELYVKDVLEDREAS